MEIIPDNDPALMKYYNSLPKKKLRERDVKDYFLKMLGALKHKVVARKIKYENRIGCPDWLVIYRGWICLVELKSPTGKLSVGQERETLRIEECLGSVHILCNYSDVDNFIEQIEDAT